MRPTTNIITHAHHLPTAYRRKPHPNPSQYDTAIQNRHDPNPIFSISRLGIFITPSRHQASRKLLTTTKAMFKVFPSQGSSTVAWRPWACIAGQDPSTRPRAPAPPKKQRRKDSRPHCCSSPSTSKKKQKSPHAKCELGAHSLLPLSISGTPAARE